jgi:hypothetical protein
MLCENWTGKVAFSKPARCTRRSDSTRQTGALETRPYRSADLADMAWSVFQTDRFCCGVGLNPGDRSPWKGDPTECDLCMTNF